MAVASVSLCTTVLLCGSHGNSYTDTGYAYTCLFTSKLASKTFDMPFRAHIFKSNVWWTTISRQHASDGPQNNAVDRTKYLRKLGAKKRVTTLNSHRRPAYKILIRKSKRRHEWRNVGTEGRIILKLNFPVKNGSVDRLWMSLNLCSSEHGSLTAKHTNVFCRPTEVQSRENKKKKIPRVANQVQTEDHGYRTAVGEELISVSNLTP